MRGAGPGESPTSEFASSRRTSGGTTPSDSARARIRLVRRDAPKNGIKLRATSKSMTEIRSEKTNGKNSELNRFSKSKMRSSRAGNAATTANSSKYERRVKDCLNSVENTFWPVLAESASG